MNPCRTRGQRDIHPVIDQNTHRARARFSNRETRKLHKSSRIKILLANLNPFGPGRNRPPDGIVQQVRARRSGIARRRIRRNARSFQRAPVRYIAKNGFTPG